MKILVAYRFTGEDPAELAITMGKLLQVLRGNSHEVYCSIEDEEWFKGSKRTNRDIMEHAFRKLDDVDVLLAFIRSDDKSEGMLLEVGYAFGKEKRFVLALKRGAKTTSIHEMADPLIEFDTIEELCERLASLNL